jgi:hypothetical protein
MSKEDGETEAKIRKTVQLVGYPRREYGSLREWADFVYPAKDWFAKETVETDVYAAYLDGEELDLKRSRMERLYGHNTGDLVIEKKVVKEEEYKATERDFAGKVRTDVMEKIKGSVERYDLSMFGSPKFRNEDGDAMVTVYRYTDNMKLLKHQSEMGPDDMFVEESGEMPVVKLKVKTAEVSPEELEYIEDNVISPIMTAFSNHPAIGRTRLADCEEESKEKGVCMNI